MLVELFCVLLAPYPGLEELYYIESYSDRELEVEL